MSTVQPKRTIAVPESAYGVCLWQMPDGSYLGQDGHYLSLEGVMGDRRVEEKMRKSAEYWLESTEGRPAWISGARKVTDDEYDDQSARLRDGLIPDEYDAARQILRRTK
jgi:hypothetical protein